MYTNWFTFVITKTKRYMKTQIQSAQVFELVATGKYDEKAMAKYFAKEVKGHMKYGATQSQAVSNAEAMLRIYKHTFEIRTSKLVA